MKIAFLGLPLAAVLLHGDGHDIVLAAISRADGVGLRRTKRLVGSTRVFMKPKLDRVFLDRVREAKPDLVVSWYWTNLIPMELVRIAPLGGFGVHPSLLPRHRGPDPTTWAILAGDEETGVSAHRIEADYDTGDVLLQEKLRIDPTWSAFDLARALDRPSLRVLRRVARAFSRGEELPHVAQRPEDVTLAPFPGEELESIRWARPAADILRQVRALSPAPGASTEIAGVVVTILRARETACPAVLEEPGESAFIGGRALVRSADSAVEVLEAEIEGQPASRDDLARLFGGRLV